MTVYKNAMGQVLSDTETPMPMTEQERDDKIAEAAERYTLKRADIEAEIENAFSDERRRDLQRALDDSKRSYQYQYFQINAAFERSQRNTIDC